MLRKHGVVGKFVEFFGPGLASLPLADRATIANMAPEYGATCAIFPIDAETLRYLRVHRAARRSSIELVEAYAKEQGLWHDEDAEEPDVLRHARARPRRRRAVARRPQAPAGPRLADRVQARRSAMALEDYCRDEHDDSTTRPARRVLPGVATRPRRRPARRQRTTRTTARAPAARRSPTGRGAVAGHARRRHGDRARPRPRRDRRDHLLHEHVEPVGDARRRACSRRTRSQRGLTRQAVGQDLARAGLEGRHRVLRARGPHRADLEALGFHLVGYGCTTCIGNSGPLPEAISDAVKDERPRRSPPCSRGNRNFEGRINPDVRMNYLASPPLVVAYALAGTMDIDLYDEPLGTDSDGEDVFLKDIWPTTQEVARTVEEAVRSEMFTSSYGEVFEGDERWQRARRARRATASRGTTTRPTCASPPFFEDMPAEPAPVDRHRGRARARHARRLGHDRPHLAGGRDQEGRAGRRST